MNTDGPTLLVWVFVWRASYEKKDGLGLGSRVWMELQKYYKQPKEILNLWVQSGCNLTHALVFFGLLTQLRAVFCCGYNPKCQVKLIVEGMHVNTGPGCQL